MPVSTNSLLCIMSCCL